MARKYGKSGSGGMFVSERPGQEAAAVDAITDRLHTIKDIAESCGLPESTTKQLLARLETRWQPLSAELQRVKTQDLVGLLEDRAWRALQYLDDYALAGASAKDLAITIGVLIEKRQLLRGEPTQIMTSSDRQSLNDLLPLVMREAQRRGYTIDVNPATGDVEGVSGSRVGKQSFRNLTGQMPSEKPVREDD